MNFKINEKIICIDNLGLTQNLTVGKEYIVLDAYIESGKKHIQIVGDSYVGDVFSSRF